MDINEKRELICSLSRYVTAEKWEKLQRIARDRTRYVTVVLENIHQELNMSAALRSIECFGVQDAYIVDSFADPNRVRRSVTKGSDQWLTITRFRGIEGEATQRCFDALKAKGYQIVATMPHAQGQFIGQLSLDKKIALVFGSESNGISGYAQNNADAYVAIPMYGLTQSFNVAASVAICLYDVVTRLHASSLPWRMSDDEMLDIWYTWLKKTVDHASLIEQYHQKEKK